MTKINEDSYILSKILKKDITLFQLYKLKYKKLMKHESKRDKQSCDTRPDENTDREIL